MCIHCEGELETRDDPSLEETRAYLNDYGTEWTLTISAFGETAETSVNCCPWCGRDLLA